ncbi:Thioredoxin-like chloroplastic [Chlorella sorokiniana]|uniref:Thioredoxin-like chloroplastic n=1 Tax=Chlorella sorokiniana TaxID=3076 RepID=A0A2P6U3N9_CHLSO|nr:Thioredoxin-like chloroplastic [Chlorella sorokiniana]|eukprot:PRW60916.1 Thioredoxin-like chloroplastic [Chlorella sorokiniana]
MSTLSVSAALLVVPAAGTEVIKRQQQAGKPAACPRRPTRARLAAPRPQSPSSVNNAVSVPSRFRNAFAQKPWWRQPRPSNMTDVNSVQQLVDELAASASAEQLVIVEFYATWCQGCKALFPHMSELAAQRPDIKLLLIEGEENKALSRKLEVSGLPTVLLFCGSEGRVEQMQLPASKFDVLLAAVDRWSAPRCSLGPAPPLPGFERVKPRQLTTTA